MAGGILISAPSNAVVSHNTALNNDISIWIAGDLTSSGPAVKVSKNTASGNYDYGIVYDSLNDTASHNSISNSSVGLLAVTYGNFNTLVYDLHNSYSAVGQNTQVLQPSPPYPPYTATIVTKNGQDNND